MMVEASLYQSCGDYGPIRPLNDLRSLTTSGMTTRATTVPNRSTTIISLRMGAV